MSTSSPASAAHRAVLVAVLVAGLFVGMVGMHHLGLAPAAEPVAVAGTGHGPPADEPGPAPHDEHTGSLLHLCLAVLTAVAVLVAAIVAWWLPGRPAPAAGRGRQRPRTAPRAPPPTAPARLALLCVLRT